MKRIFSGIQPTSNLHLGNYLTMKKFNKFQDGYDSLFCVVDMHAITVEHNPEMMKPLSLQLASMYMANGLDPDKCTLFIQSMNPHHAELNWILACNTQYGELSRMTQFKDKSQKNISVTAGLFFYPILMAADILLYDTDIVPVGEDQKQHVELTRDIATRFNHRFGDTFVIPEPMIAKSDEGAKIYSLQDVGTKMSKSDPNDMNKINLSDSAELIKKKIMRATTDSLNKINYDPANQPGVSNLLVLHSTLSGESIESLVNRFDGKGYGDLKKDLVDVITPIIIDIQTKSDDYIKSGAVVEALTKGAKKAIEKSTPIMERVKSRIGFKY